MEREFLFIAAAALGIMIAASVFARRTNIATPLLLVALGVGASYVPGTPAIHLEPELILAGVLPPLLYASAVQLPVHDLRRNLTLIGWLSVGMVIISALLIGFVVHLVYPGIPFALGVALGAVVSPTDAVAATAIGHRVGLPPRLMSVLEGESLVNDASALVMLRTAVAGLSATSAFSFGHTVVDFGWAVLGALVIGVVIGYLSVLLRERLDDPVLNTTISFAVPFLAYFPAEEVHSSGVLAVVAAGIVSGSLGSKRLSARDRHTQSTNWTTINFILESAVFLLVGYQLSDMITTAQKDASTSELIGLVAIVVAMLIGLRMLGLAWPALRARFTPGNRYAETRARYAAFEEHLDALEPADTREINRVEWARRRLARGRADMDFEQREPLTARGYLVLGWAGMRGVVTVAAAQTIPADAPHRATVVVAAFFVALVTLVIFGLTLPALISRLDLRMATAQEKRSSLAALMRSIGEEAIDELGPLAEQDIDGEPIDPLVIKAMKERVIPRLTAGTQSTKANRDQLAVLQQRYLDAMRNALVAERSIGAYSSDTFRQVEHLLDSMEQRPHLA
ncbi:sodium:proton antiporter [Nocardioides sp.]|uniref:cation:proton antiporter n=1 Tax=Nocardioides sp. TaxID=35761 RepID=UPI00262CC0F6|nr:sodium:proton antiporter [Nocardioides sp.]